MNWALTESIHGQPDSSPSNYSACSLTFTCYAKTINQTGLQGLDYDRWWIKSGRVRWLWQVVDQGYLWGGRVPWMSIHQPDMGKGRRHSCLVLFFAGFFKNMNYSYHPYSNDPAYERWLAMHADPLPLPPWNTGWHPALPSAL